MTKKREEVLEEKQVVVETNKKKTPVALIITLSVIAAIVVIASTVLPFVILFGIALSDEVYDFKQEDTKIYIEDIKTTIENTNNYYDKEDECYVMQFKVDRDGEISTKNSIFGEYERTLEVIYTLKDKDGYVIGEEYLMIDNYENNNKFKKSVYYCDDNAKDIDYIEAREVTVY